MVAKLWQQEQGGGGLHQAPAGWFSMAPSSPLYIVLLWGQLPADLDAHLYTPASCKHCGRTFRVDSTYRGRKDADPWAEFDYHEIPDGWRPERITLHKKKPHGFYHYYVSNADGWDGQGRPDDLWRSNATVFMFGAPHGKSHLELLGSFAVHGAVGRYGNFWDVLTMECLEGKASSTGPANDLQRCKVQPVGLITASEPPLHPVGAPVTRVEMRAFSLIAHVVENIFTYLALLFCTIFCLLSCLFLCAAKSEKGRGLLFKIAGQAQRARILGAERFGRYAHVLPHEEDSFLQDSEAFGDEAYELRA